jgi:hypothetical protein
MNMEAAAVRPAPVGFVHLARLTDDTGLLEHALGVVPRRGEGYTTDDNARALWVCLEWIELLEGRGSDRGAADGGPERPASSGSGAAGELAERDARDDQTAREPEADGRARSELGLLRRLADTYLAFLLWAQRDNGTFHNNFYYDRRPEPEKRSDDCTGRTLWALALARTQHPDAERGLAAETMLLRAAPHVPAMSSPRGWAYALSACSLLREYESASPERAGNVAVSRPKFGSLTRQQGACPLDGLTEQLERQLIGLYHAHSDNGWRWFEPVMSYGNGVLPWSLFRSYAVTGNEEALAVACESLDFLISRMTAPDGRIRPVGNRGWCTREGRSDWDQQPLDVMKLALAAEQAHRVEGRREYRDVVSACRDWFHGRNDGGVPLADPAEGSCCDGLTPDGPNVNRGAESTLSYLLAEAAYARLFGIGPH